MIPNNITISTPIITGYKRYPKDAEPIKTIIGFPPAGGWVTLKNIIPNTPNPTEIGIDKYSGKGI